MLWTLGTAIALALFRPFLETQAPSGSETAARYIAFQKFAALSLIPFGGASIAALIFAVVHRVRGGKRFPTQPGHWLLVVFGISYVLTALMRLVLMPSSSGTNQALLYHWGQVAAVLVMICVQVIPVVLVRDAPRWTIMFSVELLRRVVQLPISIGYAIVFSAAGLSRPAMRMVSLVSGLIWFMVLAGSVVLAVTLFREIHARPQRDYLHWAGCLTQAVVALQSLSYFVFIWFLR